MASVLRTYAQLFAVERFVVEPYQFGARNREALESGALWFYFRLGLNRALRLVLVLTTTGHVAHSGQGGEGFDQPDRVHWLMIANARPGKSAEHLAAGMRQGR